MDSDQEVEAIQTQRVEVVVVNVIEVEAGMEMVNVIEVAVAALVAVAMTCAKATSFAVRLTKSSMLDNTCVYMGHK